MNLMLMISDLFGEGGFGVSFVAKKAMVCWVVTKTHREKNVFSCSHRILIKVNKYLVDKCKSFS